MKSCWVMIQNFFLSSASPSFHSLSFHFVSFHSFLLIFFFQLLLLFLFPRCRRITGPQILRLTIAQTASADLISSLARSLFLLQSRQNSVKSQYGFWHVMTCQTDLGTLTKEFERNLSADWEIWKFSIEDFVENPVALHSPAAMGNNPRGTWMLLSLFHRFILSSFLFLFLFFSFFFLHWCSTIVVFVGRSSVRFARTGKLMCLSLTSVRSVPAGTATSSSTSTCHSSPMVSFSSSSFLLLFSIFLVLRPSSFPSFFFSWFFLSSFCFICLFLSIRWPLCQVQCGRRRLWCTSESHAGLWENRVEVRGAQLWDWTKSVTRQLPAGGARTADWDFPGLQATFALVLLLRRCHHSV